jgi:hypothetical protein
VDSINTRQTDLEQELRIEDRKRLLRTEKALAAHHRAIASLMGEMDHFDHPEVAQALRITLWHLGVAVVRTAEAPRLSRSVDSECA